MNTLELILCAVALSMDAFAVAICKGLSLQKITVRNAVTVGLWFGIFQALMPTVGYFLTEIFKDYIAAFSAWIAFVLLALIGGNMIKEAFSDDDNDLDASLSFKTMLILAIATSIDALATGVTFAVTDVRIYIAAPVIGVTTFLFSAVGVRIGSVFGTKYRSGSEIVGGVVLILLGLKILLTHYGIINLPF